MRVFILFLALSACSAPSTLGQPEIVFLEFESAPSGVRHSAVFELVNGTRETYFYRRQFGPLFQVKDLGLGGHDSFGPLCGTGIWDDELLPGESVRLVRGLRDHVGPIQLEIQLHTVDGREIQIVGPAQELVDEVSDEEFLSEDALLRDFSGAE